MSGFFEQNYSGAPFMANAEADETYSFLVKVDTIEVSNSDTPWGDTTEAKADFKDIKHDKKGTELAEDGEHMVPFWACEAFQKSLKDNGKFKGWVEMEYIRSEEDGINREGKEVSLSGAAFRCV